MDSRGFNWTSKSVEDIIVEPVPTVILILYVPLVIHDIWVGGSSGPEFCQTTFEMYLFCMCCCPFFILSSAASRTTSTGSLWWRATLNTSPVAFSPRFYFHFVSDLPFLNFNDITAALLVYFVQRKQYQLSVLPFRQFLQLIHTNISRKHALERFRQLIFVFPRSASLSLLCDVLPILSFPSLILSLLSRFILLLVAFLSPL